MAIKYYIGGGPGDPATDVTARVWTALEWNSSAEELNSATCEWIIEDPEADMSILAWRRVWVLDDESPADHTVIGMGSIADVHLKRSEVYGRDATCRAWHLTITDLNYAAHYRLFDEEDSPDRPDETDLARLTWFLTTGNALLLNSGTDYQDTTVPVALDEYDWTGQSAYDMFRGAMDQSGRNAFVLYDESKGGPDFEVPAAGELQLWYAHTGSALWPSTIMLSNDEADIDPANGIYPLSDESSDLHLDPTRIYWKLQVAYDGGMVAVSDLTIATVYGARETTLDASDVKSAVTAVARGNRMLQEGSTPTVRIDWGYNCRREDVNSLLAGQSFMYRATHLGDLTDQGVPDFTVEGGVELRTMDRTVIEKGPGVYYVSGSAVPTGAPVATECGEDATPTDLYAPTNSNVSDGIVYYGRAGSPPPETPSPGFVGNPNFPEYGVGGGTDYIGDCANSFVRVMVVGAGTLEIGTATYAGSSRVLSARLYHRHAGDVDPTLDETQPGTTGDTFTFTVDTHDGDECIHWVDVGDTNAACGGKFGFTGADWTSTE